MGIFDEKKSLPEKKLREAAKRDSGIIPKTGGKKYNMGERERIEKETFGNKMVYGSEISRDDYKTAVRRLKTTLPKAKDRVEREAIKNKIEYLKRLGGKTD